ncbi:MAG: ATP-binding cassette domain-containing protein [Gammaproteobacteria bacterium]|nr:ATP-binding cassette domain-containing protein [Gammaproteobacteria bacterium]
MKMPDQERLEPPLVKATGVTVRMGGTALLDKVNLSVHRGEIVTLIGPNGSGKTTLVRSVLGLQIVDEGVIEREPNVRIGYVPQSLTIDPTLPLTVTRFLSLPHPQGTTKIHQALAEVGARELADIGLQHISGGEAKRVLLARALLRDPELLVLDEPTAGMDVTGQSELYALVTSIRDLRRCGILLVSHDLHLVMAATDRVVCMNRHICCDGRPEAVSQHPEYLRLFGGDLSKVLAVYSHEHDHRHALSGETVSQSEMKGAEVVDVSHG